MPPNQQHNHPPLQPHPGPREPTLDLGDTPPQDNDNRSIATELTLSKAPVNACDEWSYIAPDHSLAGDGRSVMSTETEASHDTNNSKTKTMKKKPKKSLKKGDTTMIKTKSKASAVSSKKKRVSSSKSSKTKGLSSNDTSIASVPGAFASTPAVAEEDEEDEHPNDCNTISDYTYSNQYTTNDYDVEEGAYFDNEAFEDEVSSKDDSRDNSSNPVLLKATLVTDAGGDDHVSALTQTGASTAPSSPMVMAEVLQKIPEDEEDEAEETARQRRQRTWGIALLVAVALLGAAIVFWVATARNQGGGSNDSNNSIPATIQYVEEDDDFDD